MVFLCLKKIKLKVSAVLRIRGGSPQKITKGYPPKWTCDNLYRQTKTQMDNNLEQSDTTD